MKKLTIHSWILPIVTFVVAASLFSSFRLRAGEEMDALSAQFLNPPKECWPRTRWWWYGSAVTKEEITWELQQMVEHGIGGVEQISMSPVYEKGEIPFMSNEFVDMLKHTVMTAKSLGMQVSINFGGPGWIIGGEWVPQADRMKNLVPTYFDIEGPRQYSGPLSDDLIQTQRSQEHHSPKLLGDERLLAVVAGKIVDQQIDPQSITILTNRVEGNQLKWRVPDGRWRVMAFWLKFTRQGFAVDHFDKAAMRRYCEHFGGKLYQAFGEEFGKTVDSFFCDSFEIDFAPSGIYWSTGLLEEFARRMGYDLVPHLPAIWWQVGELSPKIRYDVNNFLHQVGLEAFFKTFLDWCAAHGVKGRIQAYGFATDNIEGSGITHIPEMEITPGEKDAVPWFDTRIGPREYVAAGAHLYGRNIVSVEAYTYIHWEPFRDTLEELKIASDGFLRAGANLFYNQGYDFCPERQAPPGRTFGGAEACISHINVWWKYYPLLAKYVARSCYLLRQGDFVADIAVYSPLANQWTLNVLNARKWTREFYWGELGKLLNANGYAFDLINDDVLQHRAEIVDGQIRVGKLSYKVLILPNVMALPLETLLFIKDYVQKGGVVIALERVPEASVGLSGYQMKDAQVKTVVSEMFAEPVGADGTGPRNYGKGRTYHIKQVINRQDMLDWRSSVLDPFVNTLREHVTPDFGIDFMLAGIRENNGLCFLHRKMREADIYFVTNIQDRPSEIPVNFRVTGKIPWHYNPYNGEIKRVYQYQVEKTGTKIPLRLAPYESMFLLFEPEVDELHVEWSDLRSVTQINDREIVGLAERNGVHFVRLSGQTPAKRAKEALDVNGLVRSPAGTIQCTLEVKNLPAAFEVAGEWKLTFEGEGFAKMEKRMLDLASWTEDSTTAHFSGTAKYELNFDLPKRYVNEDLHLQLDLGQVCNVAEVILNGQKVGTCWMRGQRLDVTKAVRAGRNELVVLVTNTLINRISAMKEPPPIPENLVAHYGSGVKPYVGYYTPLGFKPLPASGLLGPVRIVPCKKVTIRF